MEANSTQYVELNNGVKMPVMGFGPGIVGYSPKVQLNPKKEGFLKRFYNKMRRKYVEEPEYIDCVANAFKLGFRLLDGSATYKNEHQVLKALTMSGIKRSDIFITSRSSNGAQRQGRARVRAEFMETLKRYNTDYIDMYQFHWPVTGVYLETWKEIVELYKEGYVKSIGVANCHQHHLEALMEVSDVVPAVNQFEVHPLFTQKELIEYCKSKGIVVQSYSSIARLDDRLVRLPLLRNIGKKYNKTIVQVVLRWHIQQGLVPITRSWNKRRQAENIGVFDFELSDDEMAKIDAININSRLRYDPDNCDFNIL